MPASFTYMLNPTPAKEETKKEFLNKLLLIKGVKTETVKFRNKLFHERSIVKLFSSAYSGYLLKYYQCNQDNFLYKNCLLMDYSPFNVTLFDHLSLRKESLSIESKLNLLAHISNGLRFLAYYKVVHMDLNLNNILVSDGYLPKLIDFG
jgi:serine/threonine protein kinase